MKAWLDKFMSSVGRPLEWDFSSEDYEYNEDITEEKKDIFRENIYKLACEYIYWNSRSPFNVKHLQYYSILLA